MVFLKGALDRCPCLTGRLIFCRPVHSARFTLQKLHTTFRYRHFAHEESCPDLSIIRNSISSSLRAIMVTLVIASRQRCLRSCTVVSPYSSHCSVQLVSTLRGYLSYQGDLRALERRQREPLPVHYVPSSLCAHASEEKSQDSSVLESAEDDALCQGLSLCKSDLMVHNFFCLKAHLCHATSVHVMVLQADGRLSECRITLGLSPRDSSRSRDCLLLELLSICPSRLQGSCFAEACLCRDNRQLDTCVDGSNA